MDSFTLALSDYPTLRRGKTLATLPTRFALAILIYLALEPAAHNREHIAELIWPDADRSKALANLRVSLTHLRPIVGDWLHSDRRSVRLVADANFRLDLSGAICTGFSINPKFDAWLDTFRVEVTVPSPYWIRPTRSSELSAIVDFCRANVPALAQRGMGIPLFDNHYSSVLMAARHSTEPGEQLCAITALFHYSLLTGRNVAAFLSLDGNLLETEESSAFWMLCKAYVCTELGLRINGDTAALDPVGSSRMFPRMCANLTLGITESASGNYAEANGHFQVGNSLAMHLPVISKPRTVLATARSCALVDDWRLATEYLEIAKMMAQEQKSYFLFSRIRALENCIERRQCPIAT